VSTSAPALSHSLDLLHDTYNYNHWIFSLIRPYLGTRVVEIGSGPGNLTQFMLNVDELVCVEPEAEYSNRLSAMAVSHRNMTVKACCLDDVLGQSENYKGRFDSVVCLNVLEHIEDHTAAMMTMQSLLRVGGRIILFVPAVQFAYGSMDNALNHFRRYSKRDVKALCGNIGGRLVKCRYVNLLGLIGWWWCGRVRKDALIVPEKARVMDRLVPFVSALERIVPIPIGQSILAVIQMQ